MVELRVHAKVVLLVIACVCAGTGWAEVRQGESTRASPVLRAPAGLTTRAGARSQQVVRRVSTEQRVVALTLDDGPDPKYTPTVLELARRKGIKLTFFLIGQQVQLHPELARQEVAEGHAIGNHTWDHHEMTSLSTRQDTSEIERCEDELERVCGQRPHLLRPPKGTWNDDTFATVAALGHRMILWSVALEHHPARTPQQMAQRVIDMARPGMIILAHDGEPCHPMDRSKTMAALPLLVEGLQQKGYRFVTLPDLLELENETGPAVGGETKRRP